MKKRENGMKMRGFLVLLLLVLGMTGCVRSSSGYPTVTVNNDFPVPESDETWDAMEVLEQITTQTAIAQLATSTPDAIVGEVNDITMDISGTKLGQVLVKYPSQMEPRTSNIVMLSVFLPKKLASIDVMTFDVVEIPTGDFKELPAYLGDLTSYPSHTYLDGVMKAGITKGSFIIEADFPPIQSVDIQNYEKTTFWVWSIIAPESEGLHTLTLNLYLDENGDIPSWTRSFHIQVVSPTPIPSDTPVPSSTPEPSPTITHSITPSPTPTQSTLQRISEKLIEDSATLILEIVALLGTLIAGLFAIIRSNLKRKDEIAALKNQLNKAETENEILDLEEKIAKLEAIKWWHFWR